MSRRAVTFPVVFLLAAYLAGSAACASTRPAPKKAPGEAELLVQSLTSWLELDRLQQQRTLESAQQWVARNTSIRAGWERGERMRPQALLESRALFERDLLAILTPPQAEKIQRLARLMAAPLKPVLR